MPFKENLPTIKYKTEHYTKPNVQLYDFYQYGGYAYQTELPLTQSTERGKGVSAW